MSKDELVAKNIGRDGRNLLISSGARKGTVVIDCNECTLRYASFWNGAICIRVIDLINGQSDIYIPPKYFSVDAIHQADCQ